MDNNKNDIYYLEKLKHHFERINKTMNDVDYDTFANDENIQEICMFNIIQISELSKKLSENFKKIILIFPGMTCMN